jgi:hypothetical protein
MVLKALRKVQMAVPAAVRVLCVSLAVAALAAVAGAPALAQPPARELLNSERIAAAFGSYGVEVVAQDDTLRISNLYSTEAGVTTCRTFATVDG